ncbi:MAG TPA: YciI family protein, partial [Gemmatimonadales bacterium]
MKYLLLVYIDHDLLAALPAGEFDAMMRGCLARADELERQGVLLDYQMLEDAHTARTVRVRDGRTKATDGPFAEAKEVLGGFNLIEADSLEEAERIAAGFPWTRTGSIEV